MNMRKLLFLLFLSFFGTASIQAQDYFCDGSQSNLMQDLMTVNSWNKKINERFPVYFNNLLQGGYISMPSARMSTEGQIGAGYAQFPPYYSYNLRVQLVDFLEVSGNYRVFKGVDDPVLTKYGFGDYSDKGANVKLSIFSPEATRYALPGLAIGTEDFLGTKSFNAYYIVATKVFLDYNLEVSLGYGAKRIRGFFGGMHWAPFRHHENPYLKDLAFVMEYDAIPYRDETREPHPEGRKKLTGINVGVKYRVWDFLDLSLSYIRGDAVAFTVSSYYDLGATKGIIPKIADALPYRAPVNTEAIGCLRPTDVMVQDFAFAFQGQGLFLKEAWINRTECKTSLRFVVVNGIYREEHLLRTRLNAILVNLAPADIDEIIIVIDGIIIPIQEYRYDMRNVRSYVNGDMGNYELATLTPLREVSYPNLFESKQIFYKRNDLWNFEVLPKTQTLFGSAGGKFKYALGLSLNLNGFLWNNTYYTVSLGYYLLSDLHDVADYDRLNPSQIINVRSDVINYFKQESITIDEAYIEKMWNVGKGWYSKIGLGYFEPEYGGVTTEVLYYPINSNWAVGLDFALVKKRNPTGLRFTNKIRKFKGLTPHYYKFTGSQYFLNIYYDWASTGLDFKVSTGKFLANDFGIRTEVSRYFPSGLQLGFWYTYTNGHDKINGQTYHDKGIFFTMPLDIFYTKSSRSRWGYGMSAWLRDVGVSASTGSHLYEMINQQRQ